MRISVDGNIKEFSRRMKKVQRKQIPFATMLAVNDTVKILQDAAITQAQRVFNNRKKWYVKTAPSGFHVKRATKQNLRAAGSISPCRL